MLDGSWELCSQPNFAGDCKVLDAGRYATLEQALNHRIESARPIAKAIEARGDFDREARRDEDRDTRGRDSDRSWSGRYARGDMDIFPGAGFRGRPMHLDGDAASLEEFSDRASSVVIHDGTWQLCSQPGYEGRCRTFGPGRYASLGPLDNQVASAKLIR